MRFCAAAVVASKVVWVVVRGKCITVEIPRGGLDQ